jgi:hypothetical protein
MIFVILAIILALAMASGDSYIELMAEEIERIEASRARGIGEKEK